MGSFYTKPHHTHIKEPTLECAKISPDDSKNGVEMSDWTRNGRVIGV